MYIYLINKSDITFIANEERYDHIIADNKTRSRYHDLGERSTQELMKYEETHLLTIIKITLGKRINRNSFKVSMTDKIKRPLP